MDKFNLNIAVARRETGQILLEDYEKGLILTDFELKNRANLGFSEYGLLDYRGTRAALVRKKWLDDGRASKSELIVIDIKSAQVLFRTSKLLAYRAMFSADARQILIEAYSGLYIYDIDANAQIAHKKTSAIINYAALHAAQNQIYIPTERKKLLIADFGTGEFGEIAVQTNATKAVKFLDEFTLVADAGGKLYCFEGLNLGGKAAWKLDLGSRHYAKFCYEQTAKFGTHACIYTHKRIEQSDKFYKFDLATGELLASAGIEGRAVAILDENRLLMCDMSVLNWSKK